MKHFLQVILIIVLFSCEKFKTDDNPCAIDYTFKGHFQNCINIISVYQLGVYTGMDTYDAYYCLNLLSDHQGLIDMNSDTKIGYQYSDSVNFFCQDLEVWLKWYDNNKCGMTMEKSMEILKSQSWPAPLEEMGRSGFDCVLNFTDDAK